MSRRYLDRIQVWVSHKSPDGAGGYVLNSNLLTHSWAKVSTIGLDRAVAYGLDSQQVGLSILLRYRADVDYEQPGLFFTYKGREVVPYRIYPVDFKRKEIRVLGHYIAKNT